MYIDEGPSEEDLERFGGDSGYCPECGEEIWDAAEACPSCGQYIGGEVLQRKPAEHSRRKQVIVLIVLAVLVAFVLRVLF